MFVSAGRTKGIGETARCFNLFIVLSPSELPRKKVVHKNVPSVLYDSIVDALKRRGFYYDYQKILSIEEKSVSSERKYMNDIYLVKLRTTNGRLIRAVYECVVELGG